MELLQASEEGVSAFVLIFPFSALTNISVVGYLKWLDEAVRYATMESSDLGTFCEDPGLVHNQAR